MPGKSLATQAAERAEADLGQGLQSQYHPGFAVRATDACLLGATNADLASLFGVIESTIDRWLVEFPRFRRAVRNGREGADEKVARSLYHRATGMKVKKQKAFNVAGKLQTIEIIEGVVPDVNAAALWLSNRQRGKWRAATAGDQQGNGFDLAQFVGALAAIAQAPKAQPGDDAKPIDPLPVVSSEADG